MATIELPADVKSDPQLYAGCMGGASKIEDIEIMLQAAGFTDISITPKDESRDFIQDWAPGQGVEDYVISAYIQAIKPA